VNQHVLDLLEFSKVCQLVAQRTHSSRGRLRASSLVPLTDRASIEREIDLVRQMRDLWLAGYDPGPIDVGELGDLIPRLSVDGDLLQPLELLEFRRFLVVSTRVRRALDRREVAERFPGLHELGLRFQDFQTLVRRLDEVFDPAGEFLDTASPALARIRARLRSARAEAGEALLSLARRESSHPEESFVTLRDGRYVLAVRAQDRGRMQGIVHGHSGSGQTVFLEPLQAMERNNAIAEMEAEEQQERIEILRELSSALRGFGGEIERGFAACEEIDCLRARGRLALDLDACAPTFNDGDCFRILAGRHPLLAEAQRLGGAEVVPLDLELSGEGRTLVLSGPNMGGKTVALKTVGLLAAMAQAGLLIPAGDGTDLPVTDGIFVDLGDEQSIEQETSTFAGHLRNIALAWKESTDRSLVLLDELGGGTDPDEGTALGRALLELLADRGGFVLATTHLSGLKLLAHEHARMVNAAMEFDSGTSKPTYRLRLGSPGRSRAFELARRILPPGELLTRAEGYRSRWTAELDELLSDLERKRRLIEEELDRLRAAESGLQAATERRERQAERLKQRLHALRQARLETAGRDVAEAEALLSAAKRLHADTERLHAESGRSEQAAEGRKRTGLTPALADLRETEDRIQAARSRLRETRDPKLKHLDLADSAPGQSAFSPELQCTVRIETEPDGAGRVWVSSGAMRVQVPLRSLCELQAEAPSPPRRSAPQRSTAPAAAVERQIDLRGRTAEEGRLDVERYIDRASMAGVPEVRIIHGKGTGALKRSIEELLASHPLVESFRTGEPHEGGWGATIARLRSSQLG
jgi:DNA mismatch repair protein MutS2